MAEFPSVRRSIAVLAFCAICSLSAPASAQYFGRNKVQYRTFDFQVLKTEHFDIYYYPSEQAGVDVAARLAERWYVRLERMFQHRLRGRQPLILYGSHVDFEQTNVIGGELGEGTGGVTESLRRRIVLPLAGPLADTDHVIGHELVHAFQFDITTSPDSAPGQTGAERLPLWFIEGMAEYLSIGPVDANTAMWLRDAARQEKLPAVKNLNDPKYFPYRWGHAFWAYVGGRWGDEVIGRLLTVAAIRGVDEAFEQVLGVKTQTLSSDWQASILKTYTPVLTATTKPGEPGRLVIEGKELGADLNVGPSISPDGRLVAFLSARGFFSIDLYIAETSTGRITKKLTSTASNPHYSSIQFIYSAGAWDRDSRQLAVATVTSGHPALAIFDAQRGSVSREIPVPDLDEISGPTWAPDGHAIAFTGMRHGLTDLFIYDLNTGKVRQLTSDPFADVQAAWSPDGRRIAFATDRFSSNMGTLAIGPYQLALIDPDSGVVEPVPTIGEGKHINPQWSPDGRSLYFISDREGISNVYRTTLGAGSTETAQLTTVVTGVSGITSLSPAVSVASGNGTVAFSVYEGSKYDILTLEPDARGGPPRVLSMNAAVLPPADRKPSEVAELLASPALGLPEPASLPVEPYRGKLALQGVTQPVVGVGVSRFGASLSGGIALSFSDMLGDHILATAVQVNSGIGGSTSVKDIGAQVGYFDLSRRWNWGLIGGQVPYLSSGYSSGVSRLPNGDVVQTDQLFVYRQTERSATSMVSYPFDRARRVEFQGGVSSISFDQIVTTTTYSLYTGAVYDQTTTTTPLAETLNLGVSSAAYVFDTSVFGATSPVQGQRYRFEASPTFGTLNFTGLLADYRRYFMPASFYTLAVRVMEYGRYGRDSEDHRLYPLYIGYPGLVRGYDTSSIDSSECTSDVGTGCEVIDRLLGSRMLIGNLELRFPLLRPFGVSNNMYGPLPVEVALFVDSGTAWYKGERPSIIGGSREGVTSLGVAFRANLFGFAVGEFDFARPLQRPGRGWVFGFNLMPGW
jgi:Tol biopolymer transport system component